MAQSGEDTSTTWRLTSEVRPHWGVAGVESTLWIRNESLQERRLEHAAGRTVYCMHH